MRGLVRHHGLMRALPKVTLAAIATATLGVNLVWFDRARQGSAAAIDRTGLFEIVILFGGLLVLLNKETGLRSTPWVRGLPVEARTLWSAHLQTLVLAVSLVVLAMAAVVLGLMLQIRGFEPLEPITPAGMLSHFGRPWLLLMAVALCLGSWRPGLADPGRARGWNRWRWTLAGGSLVLLLILLRLPWPIAILTVLGALAWAGNQRRSLPSVLTLADQPEAVPGEEIVAVPGNGRRVVHWIILRQLFKWPLTWILGVPMTFLLGLVLGGLFSYTEDADFARYFNVWITVYMVVAFVGFFLENLHRVDHLPISRGRLLKYLLVPNLAALLVGGLIGTGFDLSRSSGESLVFENDGERAHHGLLVPVDLWRPAWGSPPEEVTAPWGESVSVAKVRVIRAIPLYLWKPFTTEPGSSPDFVAWQISRAIEKVHGVTLDPDSIRQRYLDSASDGSVIVRDPGLTLVADGLVPARGAVGPVLGLLLGFAVFTSLVVCWGVFSLCGPGVTRRRMKTVYWSAMGLLMVLHLGGYALLMSRTVKEWTVSALVEGAAARIGDMGPSGWILTWLVGLVAAAAAWRLCARSFERVEAVPGTSSCLF